MPTADAHLELSEDIKKTMQYLREDINNHAPWVTTTAFYRALHLIEALFFYDNTIGHGGDHKLRAKYMKTKKYASIWKDYKHLMEASYIARYLQLNSTGENYNKFSDYLSPESVDKYLLNFRLKKIEGAVSKKLNSLRKPTKNKAHQKEK